MRAHAGSWENGARRVAGGDGRHRRLLDGVASRSPVTPMPTILHEVLDVVEVGQRPFVQHRPTHFHGAAEELVGRHVQVVAAFSLHYIRGQLG